MRWKNTPVVARTPILSTTPSHFTLDTALAQWRIIILT
jgi:hypothetical protein